MNKNLYRIVFNKARGMLMVVADIARSGRTGSSPSSGIGHTHARLIGKITALSFSLWLATGVIQPAQANVVADGGAPASQQPTIMNSANGTPQVNIQTPSAGGVSRNTYSQFDVNAQGVILNNSHKNVQTQLGGMVAGNPWLAKGEAKVILNEVNARDPSLLNGMVEVAGKRAEVVIANPSGITCNGCGFINANRATLTTGQPQMANGNLTGYNIERGEVAVEGAGMDGSRTDYTDIIARSVKINAGVWANELNVTTGRNKVDAAHTVIEKTGDDPATRPQMALDVSSLGGMYAGKIRMVGTESGVGVRNAGSIGAQAGSVTITADGRIDNSGSLSASGDAQLTAGGDISNSGAVYAASDARVRSAGALANSGSVVARNNTQIQAASLESSREGVLAAGVQDDGTLANQGSLQLSTAGQLSAHGQNLAGGSLSARGQGVDLSNSETQSASVELDAGAGALSTQRARVRAQQLTARTGGLLNNDGGTLSADALAVSANSLSNQQGTLAQTGSGDLTLSLPGAVNNQQGQIGANGNLTLGAQSLNNQSGQLLAAQTGSLTAQTQETLDNRSGTLAAGGDVRLSAGAINNDDGRVSAASGQNTLTAAGAVTNRKGRIESAQGTQIVAAELDNQQGVALASTLEVQLNGGALNNASGHLLSQGALRIDSGELTNDAGLIQSGAAMAIDTHGAALSNQNSGDSGGISSVGELSLTTGALDNRQGFIVSRDALTFKGLAVDNRDGQFGSEQALTASFDSWLNSGGSLKSGAEMALSGAQWLDNSDGTIGATKALTLNADELRNQQGATVSGETATVNVETLDNRAGQLAALSGLAIAGEQVNNDDGGLIQSGAGLTINADELTNRNSGDKGGLTSQQAMWLTADNFVNDGGLAFAAGDLTFNGGALDNRDGQLVAQQTLSLATGAVANQSGLMQGDGITLNSNGQTVNNQSGTVNSLGGLTLASGAFNNQDGTLGAKGTFDLTATQLDNRSGGRVIGESAVSLHANDLQNSHGQIQAVGDLLLDSARGLVDNVSGLIRSGAALTLNATRFINQNTQGDNQGLEAQSVALNTQTLNNQQGSILADERLAIHNDGTLDNRGGALAASGELSILGDGLTLVNQGGVAKAGENLSIDAESLSGDGQLLSLGDMTLKSAQGFANTGSTIANGNLTFTTPGGVVNSGKLLAGKTLDLHSDSLTNKESGEISAGQNQLNVNGTLLNRGLIDGVYTRLYAGTLTNTGTGRIYGDAIGVNAGTFNNLAENGTAATLAGRERVDLGVGTLNNRDHALIYSAGDMAIGGALADSGAATGRAEVINNHSSTIESAGDMWLSAGQINNVNDHFSTAVVEVSREDLTEYQHTGSTNRWKAGDDGVFVDRNSSDGLLNLNTPEDTGPNNDSFNQYDYTRTVLETQIQESDPAKILAGGDMSISADTLFNDKSQIVAGGTLATELKNLQNVEVDGERQTTDVGTVTYYHRIRHKGSDEQGRDTSAYSPPTVIQTIALKPSQLVSRGDVQGSDLTIAPLTLAGTQTSIGATGAVTGAVGDQARVPQQQTVSPGEPVTPLPGQQFEVNPPQGAIRIVGPNTTLPDNSLFKVNPDANVPYLVETDPRFTNEKTWLGSDYMQNAFTEDGDTTLKRLGDGYYEQRLVREQVIALTGQRYLDGYNSDEAQFKALMDAGVTFGKQYSLKLGVALTPEQMALLTGDIVWLVNTQVKLPNGAMETVLVPQVYAKVKPGDINGAGALIAGNNVSMKLDGELFNSGTIAGRRVLQLEADNITNQAGTIQAADVNLSARTDINNVGGILQGSDSLLARAGRDINATTTTRSADSVNGENRFARTTIDSVSGIYVQNDSGKLALQAGRDINLTGAQAANSGENSQTQLSAGRDLNLNTVTTASRDNIVWDKDNTLQQGRADSVGSQVSGQGDVLLLAGNDINATAASVSAGEALRLAAARNVTLEGAENRADLDERHKVTGGNGWLSKTTTTTRDVVDRQTVQGSELSGNTVNITAGNDLSVRGSSVAGTGNVALLAGNDLTLDAMRERNDEQHLKQEKKSGLMGTGGIGLTVGSRKETIDEASQRNEGQGSLVGSIQGDTLLIAGNNYRQSGSTVASPQGNVVIQGKNVTIEAAQNTFESQYKRTLEQKGFTLAVNVPVVQAVRSAVGSVERVGKSNDDRINMLAAANAAWGSARAANAVADSAQGIMQNGAQGVAQNVSVSLTYGQSKQTNTETVSSNSALASSVNAGKNAVVVATGGDRSDINIIGSDVAGRQGTLLQADNDVNIVAAEQTRHDRTDNSSSGWNAGVAVSYGQGGASFGVTAGGNRGKGYGNGDEVSWRNSHVGDEESLTRIISGGDTTLRGGQVLGSGVNINADNLYIESLQDTMTYQGEQKDIGGQVTVGYGFSASGSYGQSKVNADYASVQEQSGIFAGDDGYQIDIHDRTDLKGGLITSSDAAEQAGRNRFSTGTLSWSDIDNRSGYNGNGFGIGGGVSMNGDFGLGDSATPQSGKTVTDENGNTAPAQGYASLQKDVTFGIGHDSGSERSVTRSGINTANITLTKPDEQQQLTGKTVDETVEAIKTDVSRDTAAANAGALVNDFDKSEVFKELNLQVKVTREFKDNANRQIAAYIDDKQAAARGALKAAMATGDVAKRDEALNEIYKLQYQRRFLQTLVGVVAGSPEAAITQGTLATAATAMREETVKNSLLFGGITDSTGTVYSNVSGNSSGLYDGIKAGGVRVGLDIYCGQDNTRCGVSADGSLLKDANGYVVYKGFDEYNTMDKLMASDLAAGLYGPTGGFQGGVGTLPLVGEYTPGTFWGDMGDTLVEGFAGTHDFIGGQLPGFYDSEGNTTRNRSPLTNIAADSWTVVAIPIAAPFAASEMVSPELLEFIFNATN